PLHLETRFLANLANGGLLRLLARLEVPVHALPRRGTTCVERALECQHFPSVLSRTNDVYVDRSDLEARHALLRYEVHTLRRTPECACLRAREIVGAGRRVQRGFVGRRDTLQLLEGGFTPRHVIQP